LTDAGATVAVAAVDNDIVLKASCYGASAILWPANKTPESVGVLGQARFVVSKRLRRMRLTGSVDDAVAELAQMLEHAVLLEPTKTEIILAADIEARAAEGSHELDSGESQLAAIVVSRGLPLLQTGDKRAIRGMEALLDVISELMGLAGRVMCLEQLVHAAVSRGSLDDLRGRVCREPAVDTALAMCFACQSPNPSANDVLEGLASYIEDLRRDALRVLVA
jgi:hypothetical protein